MPEFHPGRFETHEDPGRGVDAREPAAPDPGRMLYRDLAADQAHLPRDTDNPQRSPVDGARSLGNDPHGHQDDSRREEITAEQEECAPPIPPAIDGPGQLAAEMPGSDRHSQGSSGYGQGDPLTRKPVWDDDGAMPPPKPPVDG